MYKMYSKKPRMELYNFLLRSMYRVHYTKSQSNLTINRHQESSNRHATTLRNVRPSPEAMSLAGSVGSSVSQSNQNKIEVDAAMFHNAIALVLNLQNKVIQL